MSIDFLKCLLCSQPVGITESEGVPAFALLQKQVEPQGRICITADGNIEPLVLTSDFHEKELQIIGSSDGWDYHQHAAWYFREVQQHATHLEQLFELRIARTAMQRIIVMIGLFGEQFFTISLSQPTLLLSARLDPRLLRSGDDISPLQP